MNSLMKQGREGLHGGIVMQVIIFGSMVLIMGNLNAVVDYYLHPDIPYFDNEHLIVGGATALASSVLFGLLMLYIRHLRNALATIKALEAILPICTYCKKIRKPHADPERMESWEPLEEYVTERTTTLFSHGVCPKCLAREFPEYNA